LIIFLFNFYLQFTNELLQSIDYYLEHEKERENIAHNGQIFVKMNYKFVDSLRKALWL